MDRFTETLALLLKQHDLRLEQPEGLLLLLAIPLFWVLGIRRGEEMGRLRQWLIHILRMAVVTTMAIALSRPVLVKTDRTAAVVFLADLSDSLAGDTRVRMENVLADFWRQREDAPTYLVGFASQPKLLADPSHRRIRLSTLEEPSGTDLAAAVRFGYGLFPPGHDRRMVLLSEGDQTHGSVLDEAKRARGRDVEISTIPMLAPASVDVRLSGITGPDSLRTGEEAEYQVELVSNATRRVRIRLWADRRVVHTRRLRVKQGVNRVVLPVRFEKAGWHGLSARVYASPDRYPQNNVTARRLYVLGRPQVLLVQERDQDNPLRTVLQEGRFEMKVVSVDQIPQDVARLAEYDAIFLDDLELARLPAETVGRLYTYVEQFGGGLVVTVGSAGADLANPKESAIEDLLPVAFKQVDKKEEIPAALAFVMDRSSSMARGEKFVILLRAVADTLDRLPDTAQVAMVMFDDFPEVIVPLTEAKNRDSIRKVLLSQRVGGGTSLFPGLEAANKQLKKSAAKLKHVLLLSDGQSMSLFDHYGYIVSDMTKNSLTISTVALGKDADQPELKKIADHGSGRFYFTDTMANVPKIFTAETERMTESNVVEQSDGVMVVKQVQALAGIDFESAPPLLGHVASEARPTAEVVLASKLRKEPLMVRWRYGLGRVTLFTTDAQGNWAGAWTGWTGFGRMWPRVVEDAMRTTPPGDMRLQARTDGDRGLVTVRVPLESADQTDSPPLLRVKTEGRRWEVVDLVRRGLGLYRADFKLPRSVAVGLQAERVGPTGTREVAFGSIIRPYAEEYLSATGNPDLLKKVARITNGFFEPDAAQVFRPGRQERRKTEPLWPLWVLWAMGLFLGEVFIRRV